MGSWGGIPTIGTDFPGYPSIPGAGTPSWPSSSGGAPIWQQLLLGGLFGAGELGNLIQSHKESDYQNYLLNVMKNPALLSQMVLKAQQPISAALVQDINNRVQGDLAQRGLAQAPGIFGTTEAQALAPFEQQNYQTALQQVLASLQLPGSTFNRPQANLSPLLSLFLQSLRKPQTGTPTGVPQQTTQQPGIALPAPDPNSPPDINVGAPTPDWGTVFAGVP